MVDWKRIFRQLDGMSTEQLRQLAQIVRERIEERERDEAPSHEEPEEKGEASEAQAWKVRVRWHTYDQAPVRVEWLELPPELGQPGARIHRMAEWISTYLREREGLPPDSHKPGERVLWFEWDLIRPA